MERQAQPFAPRRERGMDSFKRTMRRGGRKAGRGGLLRAEIKGVLVAASVTVIAVAVFALLLNWWNASDGAISAINQVVKFVSILAGVTTALNAGASGGAARGACVGMLYMALGIVVCSLLMGQSPQLTAYLADLGMGLAAGGLFGMILTSGRRGG